LIPRREQDRVLHGGEPLDRVRPSGRSHLHRGSILEADQG
jgi:hypothetical protein